MDPNNQCKIADECYNNNRYYEAKYHYTQAIENLLTLSDDIEAKEKTLYYGRIRMYLDRVDEIKLKLECYRTNVNILKNIPIAEDQTQCTFERLFGSYFDESVTEMHVEDTYLNNWHKISILIIFLEFVVTKCPKIRFINVVTKKNSQGEKAKQSSLFADIIKDLSKRNIIMDFKFDETLHDRKIILNNGIIIKIGRGFDFYKPLEYSVGLGLHDLAFRKCRKTEVDILRSKEVL